MKNIIDKCWDNFPQWEICVMFNASIPLVINLYAMAILFEKYGMKIFETPLDYYSIMFLVLGYGTWIAVIVVYFLRWYTGRDQDNTPDKTGKILMIGFTCWVIGCAVFWYVPKIVGLLAAC